MSYVIEQKIGNHTYLYEVKSYWDPQKKQPRQKRKYLGKKDPMTGQLCQPRNSSTPRLAKDYGHVYLLRTLAKRIGLTQILDIVFPEESQTLLALACFEISEAAPLYLFPYWVEATFVEAVPALSAKDLTTLTDRLGRMERERLEFSRHWVKQAGQIHAVAFDITSLSSYSELLEYVEWGYNRDHEHLPQVNLGIIYAENTHLPLHYQLYPGSIPDVSTLQNMLHYLALFHVKDLVFITDRGFYSATNLERLHHAHLSFILPLPRTVRLFSTLLSKHKRSLAHPVNAFVYHDDVLGHVHDTVTINTLPLQAHLFFSEQRKSDQTSRFLRNVLELETAAQQESFQSPKEARTYLSRHLKGASRLFQVTTQEGRVTIARKPQTLSRRMGNMGTTIMLTNHEHLTPLTILDWYRRKDYLEKTFDVLKNECDGKRLRGHSRTTVEGRLFLKFLSLILYAALSNTMRDQHLFKQYSVKELMYELKKLKRVELNNGKTYLTEISKRQKHIFTKFNVNIPSFPT